MDKPKNVIKVEVKINNMEYSIVSNETEEYVQRVALLVNKKVNEVKEQSGTLSTAMLTVLASMNLADELLKTTAICDNLRNEISTYMDEAQRNGVELERKKLEVETLREDLHKLEIELAKRETEIENLRANQISHTRQRPQTTQTRQDNNYQSRTNNSYGQRSQYGTNSSYTQRNQSEKNNDQEPTKTDYQNRTNTAATDARPSSSDLGTVNNAEQYNKPAKTNVVYKKNPSNQEFKD